jgi:hypothetical protein
MALLLNYHLTLLPPLLLLHCRHSSMLSSTLVETGMTASYLMGGMIFDNNNKYNNLLKADIAYSCVKRSTVAAAIHLAAVILQQQ